MKSQICTKQLPGINALIATDRMFQISADKKRIFS